MLLYSDNDIFLVQTKNLKGHRMRVMAVSHRHIRKPSFVELTKAYLTLIRYMRNLGVKRWFLVGSDHASIKDHFHIIGCDDVFTDQKEFELFNKTSHVEVSQ